jgi:hypothetical protein
MRRLAVMTTLAVASLVSGCGLQATTGGRASSSPPPAVVPAITASADGEWYFTSPDIRAIPCFEGAPLSISIEHSDGTVYISSALGAIGLNSLGEIDPPDARPVWFNEATRVLHPPGCPGIELSGGITSATSVIVGHVSKYGGVFHNLQTEARKGDVVTIRYRYGVEVRFVGDELITADKSEIADPNSAIGQLVFNSLNPLPNISVCTCNPGTPFSAGHYEGGFCLLATIEEIRQVDTPG